MTFSSDYNIDELNNAQLVLHHAVQFIAISGKYLLEKKEDDSHTNMSWHSKTNTFYSESINKRARVSFHVPTFTLKITGPTGIELSSFSLVGKTKNEALTWLSKALQLKQIDTSPLKLDLHYNIPFHSTDEGKPFPYIDKNLLAELANHRSIADKFCSEIFSRYANVSPARTWPHHFDHSVLIPLATDADGNTTNSLSVGYAIADSIIKEPYFYVTQININSVIDYTTAPNLQYGSWFPKKLNGAALPLSDILEIENQIQDISAFIENAITFYQIKS